MPRRRCSELDGWDWRHNRGGNEDKGAGYSLSPPDSCCASFLFVCLASAPDSIAHVSLFLFLLCLHTLGYVLCPSP
ncbi:hypothetical protein JB92DRAFT_1495488 [Gautieria morchelliformis]|nr:hypothetical protein JB92DRAFT_1495488 [Gautieria morchelliformis]